MHEPICKLHWIGDATYRVDGPVKHMYDMNAGGDLIPITFYQTDNKKVTLCHLPSGTVYAKYKKRK